MAFFFLSFVTSFISLVFGSAIQLYSGSFVPYILSQVKYDALGVLFPVLLGIKGNVELSLTSRVGTLLSKGNIPMTRFLPFIYFATLQALGIGIFTTLLSCVFHSYTLIETSKVILISISTIGLSVSFLNLIVFFLVYFVVPKFSLNLDDFSGPLMAALGDVVALFCIYFTNSLQPHFQVALVSLFIIFSGFSIYQLWSFDTMVLYFGTLLPISFSSILQLISGGLHRSYLHPNRVFNHQLYIDAVTILPTLNGLGANCCSILSAQMSSNLASKNFQVKIVKSMTTNKHKSKAKMNKQNSFSLSLQVLTLIFQCILTVGILHMFHIVEYSVLWIIGPIQSIILLLLTSIIVTVCHSLELDPDLITMSLISGIGDLISTTFVGYFVSEIFPLIAE